MIQNPTRRAKLRSTLIVICLATLPCYLLGLIVLWVGNSVKNRPTSTPTLEITTQSPWGTTATLFVTVTNNPTETPTPTLTTSPTPSATYFIPSSTPTLSPTPSATATLTPTVILTEITPPVETTVPSL